MYDGVASGPGPSQQSGQQTGFYSVPQNATDTDVCAFLFLTFVTS